MRKLGAVLAAAVLLVAACATPQVDCHTWTWDAGYYYPVYTADGFYLEWNPEWHSIETCWWWDFPEQDGDTPPINDSGGGGSW